MPICERKCSGAKCIPFLVVVVPGAAPSSGVVDMSNAASQILRTLKSTEFEFVYCTQTI